MLDIILSYPLLLIITFVVILSLRRLVFTNSFFAVLYYIVLIIIIFLFGLVTLVTIQQDAYTRLGQFIALEENDQLIIAKTDPIPYDSMLQIDLETFENSDEFRKYIQENDIIIEKSLGMSVTLFTTILVDILISAIARFRRGRGTII